MDRRGRRRNPCNGAESSTGRPERAPSRATALRRRRARTASQRRCFASKAWARDIARARALAVQTLGVSCATRRGSRSARIVEQIATSRGTCAGHLFGGGFARGGFGCRFFARFGGRATHDRGCRGCCLRARRRDCDRSRSRRRRNRSGRRCGRCGSRSNGRRGGGSRGDLGGRRCRRWGRWRRLEARWRCGGRCCCCDGSRARRAQRKHGAERRTRGHRTHRDQAPLSEYTLGRFLGDRP